MSARCRRSTTPTSSSIWCCTATASTTSVARTAPAPQGPWSPERLIARSADIPDGIYAPFLHPWSTGKELYFNLSLWSTYNVMLMRTVLP
jgi:hypothetical protein